MKVLTVLGTRPEIIKLSRVIAKLDQTSDHIIVHSGQNYDYALNEVFFEELGVRRPDYFLNAAGSNASETIGNVIIALDNVLASEQPDAVLIYGDTNTCVGVIAAKRRRIPIFHMEAGNRSFDQRVPEELNRKIVDHLSDINMTLTEHARRYLLAEGLRPETIFKIGSSMPEVLDYHRESIVASTILERLDLSKGNFFIVSAHREENVDRQDKLRRLIRALDDIAKHYGKRVLVSTHPRTRKKLEELGLTTEYADNQIEFMQPFGFFDYVALQLNSFCVISDSGTLTEESSMLGFPGVMIRDSHERPEGMDEGLLVMTRMHSCSIRKAIDLVTSTHHSWKPPFVTDYGTDLVSLKVVRLIYSYTEYVNEAVWHKTGGG